MLAGVGLLAGCTGMADPAASPQRRTAKLTHENRQLKEQIKQLETDKTILKARLAELRQRESALSQELHKLRFLAEHQGARDRTLADLTQERDHYKDLVEKLQSRLDRLNRTVADLRGLVSSMLGEQTAPKSNSPTTAPSFAAEPKPAP